MLRRLTIDPNGRVEIPEPLREELNLAAGDQLEIESKGDLIVLRPARELTRMVEKHGIWIFDTGEPIPTSLTDEVLQQIRDERDLSNSGLGD